MTEWISSQKYLPHMSRYCDEQEQVSQAQRIDMRRACQVKSSLKNMEAFLCKKYGAKEAEIEVQTDSALLGGFILRVGK